MVRPIFRTFNVLDDYNRESLRIEIDTSLPSARIVRALDELVELRGPRYRASGPTGESPQATDPERSELHASCGEKFCHRHR